MFYKTDKPEVLAAFNKFNADRATLRDATDAFAAEYDATGVVLSDSDRVFFGGIQFNENSKVNREVWRKPCRQFGLSSLRSKPTKKEFQAEFDAENLKWDQLEEKHFPNGKTVKKSDFYKTLGFDWGDLFFNSFKCFEYKGVLFIDSSFAIKDAIEILGSEYSTADAEHKKEQIQGVKS